LIYPKKQTILRKIIIFLIEKKHFILKLNNHLNITSLMKIILKSGKERALQRKHPWIFSGAIKSSTTNIKEGELVKVYSNSNDFLGIGHFQIGSIAVRVFCFKDVDIDRKYWKEKLENAINYRTLSGLKISETNNVFRLIHGEGDGFPGFICDFYNEVAVFQFHSIGMYENRFIFAEILKEILGEKLCAVYDKSQKTLPFKADIEPKNGYLLGENVNNIIVSEYGNKFKIDFVDGQKTGFFIDQRENRKLLGQYSENKKILNTFCYTGGFSVSALSNNAAEVHSVDSSKTAIELTNQNIALNFGDTEKHKSFCTDVFEYIDNSEKSYYDIIILDPPAFAKHQNVLTKALKGYQNLNLKAFEKIKKGGLIFTFSCSQVVSKEDFKKAVFEAAVISGRNVKILHQLSQPIDHPVNIFHPESEYLKGLVLFVE